MDNKTNSDIACDVYDCKHCKCEAKKCSLDKIKVSNCNGEGSKETTMCDSYKKR